ncbi:acetate--CoA ligase family protein [Burkholderiaceae bacterium FT117]|uniref:acetate--CoA ligase family protein n=1 Tax=Zeimonas sediminis TaxID=2944268 RepID=UPI0023431EE4|nr:acetate--CoA ligase family protein [Zeimonas sediminis]MCM5570470.1 acetate--CoA ligase family protein [Zeimonas sediminis]
MTHQLERLFRPRRIAVVGACPNDPTRMGTRTLQDLVHSGWVGEIYPVSSRYPELYGLPVYRSLRDLPASPDVVLARTPSAGIESLVDDAIAAGAGFLVVLAAGFAESGATGAATQRKVVERARTNGLRIVGPQSIGLINCTEGLPMSLSQLTERFVVRGGQVALLTQSGAMAISLAVRGQVEVGLEFSCVGTFGNSADVTPVEAMEWLAEDPSTHVIGLYLEGLDDGQRFAKAAMKCRAAGKRIAVLRSGLSNRGAEAVASHTASMSGDADAFRALCRQLGVVLCSSSEHFLWTLKALTGRVPDGEPRVAYASISGGACALWADHSERLGLSMPKLDATQRDLLGKQLPGFLSPSNPLDMGPAVFDAASFESSLRGLISNPAFNHLVVYMFTSSPTLMGGLEKISIMERMADEIDCPIWVIWEAATDAEWAALSRSRSLVAFRDLGQAGEALAAMSRASAKPRFEGRDGNEFSDADAGVSLATEAAVKAWLREKGADIPRGSVCTDAEAAVVAATAVGGRLVLKIVSPDVPHKSEVGGVVPCSAEPGEVVAAFHQILSDVFRHRPEAKIDGVLVEERLSAEGVELFVTVRRDPLMGLVTVVGRGGVQIEVDRDYAVHIGRLSSGDLGLVLADLRCASLFGPFRGRPALAISELARAVEILQEAVMDAGLDEIEINPLLLTPHKAWILDALVTRRSAMPMPAMVIERAPQPA